MSTSTVAQERAKELLSGKGYITLKNVFSPEVIQEARRIIHLHSKEADTVTHFHGKNKDIMHLQRRVWNLLSKGDVFIDLLEQADIMETVKAFLGDEVCLGSIAANRILPGGPGQEPHIDYPYWDLYKRSSFPMNINPSFPLNCQVTVMLDPFTPETGATAILPHTQSKCVYPTPEDEAHFYANCERTTGDPGDVVIFNGLCWHSAMPNKSSDQDRTAILIQYLPKFVKPMEDQKRGTPQRIIDSASPLLKQLLGFDYPYPQILDEAEAGNQEGQYATQTES